MKRSPFSFANINLLGRCNADCFYCLGKDLEKELSVHNCHDQDFKNWTRFQEFCHHAKDLGIRRIYITGQNTDPLIYDKLQDLIIFLRHGFGFSVGIRTNGYLALAKMATINTADLETGYTIETRNPETNLKIMGRKDIPDWSSIIKRTQRARVSIVICQDNVKEFWDLMVYLQRFPQLHHVQVRRISTVTRRAELTLDVLAYEDLKTEVMTKPELAPEVGSFEGARMFQIGCHRVTFWETVNTTANSINYFTDGTISDEYEIIKGYSKEHGIDLEAKG